MQIGFKLIAENFGPKEVVRQTVRAEEVGFDFVEVSDHFHPWVPEHEHAGFAFSMLSAAAMKTERIRLMTGVTCPTFRYHPAIVAQMAATTAVLADGRFALGVGAGERLNEHVIGGGWPSVRVRHERLAEALEIIGLLWSGGYHAYEGKHFTVEDARVFDLPETLPEIIVAISGPKSGKLAVEHGDGMFGTDPEAAVVSAYTDAGGTGARYCEVSLAYADTVDAALTEAHRIFRFGELGWKGGMADLPNTAAFAAATEGIEPADLAASYGAGPDPAKHLEVIDQYIEAGYDHLTLVNAGPDVDGFFTFFQRELSGPLRERGWGG